MDVGALDAKGNGKGTGKGTGKNKGKGKVKGATVAARWVVESPTAGAGRHTRRRRSLQRRRAPRPKRGVKKEVAVVVVGSLDVGPLSVCASESWILSVEVAEIDES